MTFKEAREKRGLTQEEVAKSIGVSQAAVSMWERGDNMPTAARLISLSNLYRIKVNRLLENAMHGGQAHDLTGDHQIRKRTLNSE